MKSTLLGIYQGNFENIKVYERVSFGRGEWSAGLALPNFGIVVGQGVYGVYEQRYLLKHEFGHILQARIVGSFIFYLFIGLPSLISAWTNGFGAGHRFFWTETWANHLSKEYFKDPNWPIAIFPCKKPLFSNFTFKIFGGKVQ